MLDHAHNGLQSESHQDIGYVQPKHCYLGETHVQSLGTLSINFLVEENLVPLKIKQIPCVL
jgi:hypothetical protein